ncbi:MAG: hypothetical protein ACRDTG_26870 [Pseudonocardiaceae bacterium]
MTQVAAAALAAVTSAVVGSRLGAVGTLMGAAGASVVTTVGTAVYRASLERSRERVRALAVARRIRPMPPFHEEFGAGQSPPTVVNAPPGDEGLTGGTDPEPPPRERSRRFPALRWGVAIGGAVGAFLLAMMVITGFELVSGQTVGDNGNGTTIARVVDPAPARPNPATQPASPSSTAPTSEAPTTTTEAPTSTVTTTPDDGPSLEQIPVPTSGAPAPSRTPPPLVPTDLPGAGG